jgi:hypothetical protein
MIPEEEETVQRANEKDLKEFVKKLFEVDANKFLNILYVMTSTVKNYRSAEILFLTLIKTTPLKKII